MSKKASNPPPPAKRPPNKKESKMNINVKHFEMLGMKAVDKVTGFKGIVTSISYDLYGCIQVVVTPEADKDGKLSDGRWFDVTRINIKGKKPVMDLPDYSKGYVSEGKKGSAEKPLP